MKSISRAELSKLIEHKGPSVSLYLSGHQGEGAPGVKQDKIKYKNLLREAKGKFLALDQHADRETELFNPLYDLGNNDGFWNEQSPGLVIFSSPGFLQTYRVPVHFNGTDLAITGDSFHIKPLLPMLNYEEGKFFILALSHDYIKLFKVENHFSQEIPLPASVPRNISEYLSMKHIEDELPFDSGRKEQSLRKGQGGSGSYDPTYHGPQYDEKDQILRFFQLIDKGLREILHSETSPLVLAGVDYLLPIYRQASSYQHIVEGGIIGNPELLSQQDLHQRGWEIVSPIFKQELENAKARFGELNTKELGSNELGEIVKAAYFGQVETLFISTEYQSWGQFDADNNRVEIHDEPQSGDIDLFDFAAQQTILKGGKVYALDLNDLPDQQPIAAIFRFKANSATA
jgi:hypothetical protein